MDASTTPLDRSAGWALRRHVALVALLVTAAALLLTACGRGSGAAGAGTASPAVMPATTGTSSVSPSPTSPAPTPVGNGAADAAMNAFDTAFMVRSPQNAYYRLSTAGGRVTFFKQAELIEMTEDAWQRSHDPAYKTMIGLLYKGLTAHSSSMASWLIKTNDDLMWASIMLLRAYDITGDKAYLAQAQKVFDVTYARSYSQDLGGGLWNSVKARTKNACIVLPASIAASMLYQSLHDASYLQKSQSLYAWLRANLYDGGSGAVYDHVTPKAGGGATVDRTTWTYNQGALIGAADLLYQITSDRAYYQDAVKTLAFAKSHLTSQGVLQSEVGPHQSLGVSAGGYKGIFVRWAAMFIARHHLAAYQTWLRQNADVVQRHANGAGLMDQDWTRRTGTGPLSAFSCSSAVVLLQWTAAGSS